MRRFLAWTLAVGVGLFGVGHLLFAIPNFRYAAACDSSALSFTGCMEFYEGIFAVLAGLSLVVAAALVVRGSLVRAAATAFVGTVVFTLFFWFAAIPTGLSDEIFGLLTLPAPVLCLVALSVLLAMRASAR